ncbi:MAG TPA: hypothetical protein VF482_21185, partial [Trebonia sp.]
LEVSELIRFCAERLTDYKIPGDIQVRRELPRNMIGKVLRRVLREQYLAERMSPQVAAQVSGTPNPNGARQPDAAADTPEAADEVASSGAASGERNPPVPAAPEPAAPEPAAPGPITPGSFLP